MTNKTKQNKTKQKNNIIINIIIIRILVTNTITRCIIIINNDNTAQSKRLISQRALTAVWQYTFTVQKVDLLLIFLSLHE